MIVNEKMTAIANAIREKTGGTEKLTLDEMPGKILGIKSYSDGIGAVKFIDVDVTVEESTTTAVTYVVDGIEIATTNENPNKWATFAPKDAYMVFVTPKEIGEPTGEMTNVFDGYLGYARGNTNYASFMGSFGYGKSTSTNSYGIYGIMLNCLSVTDGKPTGNITFNVRHHSSGGHNVIAGIYNIKVFLLTEFDWGGVES